MSPSVHYLLVLFSIGLFATICDVVRRGKLDSFFSAVWVLGGLVLFCLVLRKDVLHSMATDVAASSEGAFLIGLTSAFLMAVALFLSIRSHETAERVRALEELLGQRGANPGFTR